MRVNLDLRPYYKDYKSLLFYEELDRAKFSLCIQHSTIRASKVVLTIFKIPSLQTRIEVSTCNHLKYVMDDPILFVSIYSTQRVNEYHSGTNVFRWPTPSIWYFKVVMLGVLL